MEGLDEAAWERWKAYRTAIRKPIKPASEHAMKVKLARYGSQQDAVVSQSIENQYQGLFDLKVSKPAPGEKPVRRTSGLRLTSRGMSPFGTSTGCVMTSGG